MAKVLFVGFKATEKQYECAEIDKTKTNCGIFQKCVASNNIFYLLTHFLDSPQNVKSKEFPGSYLNKNM